MTRILVCGAGGFIGGHLVNRLVNEGHDVHVVDVKSFHKWWQTFDRVGSSKEADLSKAEVCDFVISQVKPEWVFNLACNMGGIGYIHSHKKDCMLNVLINTNLLRSCVTYGVGRYFFSSSACVYPMRLQQQAWLNNRLKEEDAYPADCEDGYGWEKLFSERMCEAFSQQVQTRVARYHNVYGSHGSYKDGREKAPAAICRKVWEAKQYDHKDIEVWGDGNQTRSFLYVDDCVEGTLRLMDSDVSEPVNIGSEELISIEALTRKVQKIANVEKPLRFDTTKPKGVRGRCSDNEKVKRLLGWEPRVTLNEGLAHTYAWVAAQMQNPTY